MELSKRLQSMLGMVVEGAKTGAEAYASASKPVDVASMAGKALGGKTLEATGSPAAATVVDVGTQLATDPMNLLPQIKLPAAALLGMMKGPGGRSILENITDANFAHMLSDITGKKEVIKEFIETGLSTKTRVPVETKEKMLNEAVRQRALQDPDWKQLELEFKKSDKSSALESDMVVAEAGTYTPPKPGETTSTSGTRG